MDPMLSLAITVHANKGCYAILLGSGVSRSAGIPTGWEIILDLARRLAHLRKEDCEPDPAAWFKTTFGTAPDYAALLDQLAKLPTERSQLLRPYFEPTAAELEERRKVPTLAHRAVASLVERGFVRVIVTTNFDRLMEKALEEAGVQPQVIASPDAVEGALPLAHARCTVFKVHGDYLDTRIKNAPHELEEYDDRINRLLDQIFDEYGVIVCGWSAEWDTALRAALERCKGHRFTTYWVSRSEPIGLAKPLIALRRAVVLSTSGAESFFPQLTEKVISLDDLSQPHPMTAKVAVATLKRYIAEDKHAIRLHDLINEETERVRQAVFDPDFLKTIYPITADSLKRWLHECEARMDTLLHLYINGCYWGKPQHHRLWIRCLERMGSVSMETFNNGGGSILTSYPALLLLYCGGIAAVAAEDHALLNGLLSDATVGIMTRFGQREQKVALILAALSDCSDEFQLVQGNRSNFPVSDYLFLLLRSPLRTIVPDDRRYDKLFDRFEYLSTICFGDTFNTTHMPIGRFGKQAWYGEAGDIAGTIATELEKYGDNWPPLKGGLCGGSAERFRTRQQQVDEILKSRMRP